MLGDSAQRLPKCDGWDVRHLVLLTVGCVKMTIEDEDEATDYLMKSARVRSR